MEISCLIYFQSPETVRVPVKRCSCFSQNGRVSKAVTLGCGWSISRKCHGGVGNFRNWVLLVYGAEGLEIAGNFRKFPVPEISIRFAELPRILWAVRYELSSDPAVWCGVVCCGVVGNFQSQTAASSACPFRKNARAGLSDQPETFEDMFGGLGVPEDVFLSALFEGF